MSAPDGTTVLRITRLGWCGLAIVLLSPWMVIFWLIRSPPVPPVPAPRQTLSQSVPVTPPGPQAKEGRLQPGPWGEIEYSSIMVEPPQAFIPVSNEVPPPRWTFKGYSETALQTLWQEAGLTPAQQQAFNEPTRRSVDATGIVVRPRPDDVIGLNARAREKIYTVLAGFPENPDQNEPFRFRADSIDDWFEGAEISPDIIALTKRLVYQRNAIVFFSDQAVVLPHIATSAERVKYLKALSRKSALLLQLHIRRDTDAAALTRYWGRGLRSKDIEPLLLSLARHPGGGSLDVIHLLPRFARSLLYTYPLPSDQPDAYAYDCHWTTFNFYQNEPNQRFTDIEYVKKTLESDYYPVVGEPMFGDVIFLLQPGGVVVHSCVFVADYIVFTKNGPGYSVPWMLSRFENVVSFYGRGQELEIRRFRLKER